jgi:hypothetical protein
MDTFNTDSQTLYCEIFDTLGGILPRELEVGGQTAYFDEFLYEQNYLVYTLGNDIVQQFNIWFDESLPIVYLRLSDCYWRPVDVVLCKIEPDYTTGNVKLQTANNICQFIKNNVPAIVNHYNVNPDRIPTIGKNVD